MTHHQSAVRAATHEGSTEPDTSEGYTSSSEASDSDGDTAMEEDVPVDYQHAAQGGSRQEDDHPMSFVEEARSLGLCQDYFADDPLASAGLLTPPNMRVGDLADPPGVQSIALLTALGALNGANAYEKWDVDKESAGFLASVMALGKDDCTPPELHDENVVSYSDLKLMEPLLRCDADIELERLKRRNEVSVSTSNLEAFPLNVDKDESVEWPSSLLKLTADKDCLATSEKWEVSKDVMEYVRDIANPGNMSYSEMIDILVKNDKVSLPRHETPPLMPLSPPFSPPMPPHDMQEMELTSTPEDLLAQDAFDVDSHIMDMDEHSVTSPRLEPKERAGVINPGELYSGLKTPTDSSSSPLRRKRVQDMRVDVPLLPADFMVSPAKKAKTVSFPQELFAMIPQPESDMSSTDSNVAEQDLSAVIKASAVSALERTGSEQLVEVDTTMRVSVPALEDSSLSPPWQLYSRISEAGSELNAQRALIPYMKAELLKGEVTWSGVSKLERVLGWSPFPARLGKLKVDEEFDDDASAARYMAQVVYEDDGDVDSLISKAEGLRLLDAHESDDEDVEPAMYDGDDEDGVVAVANSPPSLPSASVAEERNVDDGAGSLPAPKAMVQPGRLDMQTLLQRRKLEIEKASEARTDARTAVQGTLVNKTKGQKPRSTGVGLKPTRVSDLFAGGAMSSYLQLQGAISKPSLQRSPLHATPTAHCATPAAAVEPPSPTVTEQKAGYARSLPAPTLASSEQAIQVVTSPQFLSNRPLVRQVQALLRGLDWVERDITYDAAHTAERKGAKQSESAEADVTMSPVAGLILTTLQKLKQKPLPGQSVYFGIRDRIATVSTRYEKLVLLVSENRQLGADSLTQTQGLDKRDCDALCELMGFTAQLEADIEVRYVPGGEDELVKWIAAAISSHCVSGDDTKLMAEETVWERFLRNAGMNAFAAQAVLGKLKKADGYLGSDSSSSTRSPHQGSCYGLPAFVPMSAEQRIQYFGPVLGGSGVLTRVNKVVDGGWTVRGV